MRILIIANNDIGLYNFRKELIKELLEQKNEVYISLPNGKKVQSLVDMGCVFIETDMERRGTNPIKDISLLMNYHKIIKKIKPDYVITYTIKPNIYGGIACRMTKVLYAINITGLGTVFQKEGLLQKIITFLYKISCKKAQVVFFENEGNRDVFLSKNILDEEKAYVLNGAGVNLEEYTFCEYPKKDSKLYFLFIGRVMKEKGIEELFQAAEILKADRDDVVVDIVGPYEENYEEEVKRLTEQGIICYHGYQENVKVFIQRSHCLVLPSYHEGMANTILEAGAMGRPLIVSDIPGCREAVIEGKNGFLCEKANVKSLLEQMQTFIALSDEERAKMGKESYQYIQEKFDRKDVVQSTLTAMGLESFR